ncbi:unnamed protein product [Closterium sp. NIES-64]|nr:unnamed protein product [Closterium sp. NIES-64]
MASGLLCTGRGVRRMIMGASYLRVVAQKEYSEQRTLAPRLTAALEAVIGRTEREDRHFLAHGRWDPAPTSPASPAASALPAPSPKQPVAQQGERRLLLPCVEGTFCSCERAVCVGKLRPLDKRVCSPSCADECRGDSAPVSRCLGARRCRTTTKLASLPCRVLFVVSASLALFPQAKPLSPQSASAAHSAFSRRALRQIAPGRGVPRIPPAATRIPHGSSSNSSKRQSAVRARTGGARGGMAKRETREPDLHGIGSGSNSPALPLRPCLPHTLPMAMAPVRPALHPASTAVPALPALPPQHAAHAFHSLPSMPPPIFQAQHMAPPVPQAQHAAAPVPRAQHKALPHVLMPPLRHQSQTHCASNPAAVRSTLAPRPQPTSRGSACVGAGAVVAPGALQQFPRAPTPAQPLIAAPSPPLPSPLQGDPAPAERAQSGMKRRLPHDAAAGRLPSPSLRPLALTAHSALPPAAHATAAPAAHAPAAHAPAAHAPAAHAPAAHAPATHASAAHAPAAHAPAGHAPSAHAPGLPSSASGSSACSPCEPSPRTGVDGSALPPPRAMLSPSAHLMQAHLDRLHLEQAVSATRLSVKGTQYGGQAVPAAQTGEHAGPPGSLMDHVMRLLPRSHPLQTSAPMAAHHVAAVHSASAPAVGAGLASPGGSVAGHTLEAIQLALRQHLSATGPAASPTSLPTATTVHARDPPIAGAPLGRTVPDTAATALNLASSSNVSSSMSFLRPASGLANDHHISQYVPVGTDRRTAALGALAVLPDEVIDNIIGRLGTKDLMAAACVSRQAPFSARRQAPVLYVFCMEEPTWLAECFREYKGEVLRFDRSWRQTVLNKLSEEKGVECRDLKEPLHFKDFQSMFLYRRWYRCHVKLEAFEGDTGHVERRAGLSPDEFRHSYDGRRPVIMTDLTENWRRATSQWSIDSLAEEHGDVALKVSVANGHTVRMKLSDYREYVAAQHDEEPLYIFDPKFGEQAPALVTDYSVPPHFTEDVFEAMPALNRPMYRWLVAGPQRSGAGWHVDPALTSAWNTLLAGRKRWALYPPGKVPPGVTLRVDDDSGDVDYDGPTSLKWWLEVYPLLRPEDKPMEVMQRPGETIYVPSGWWHSVLNLDLTVAVTQNFASSANFDCVCLDMVPGRHRGVARAGRLAIEAGEKWDERLKAMYGEGEEEEDEDEWEEVEGGEEVEGSEEGEEEGEEEGGEGESEGEEGEGGTWNGMQGRLSALAAQQFLSEGGNEGWSMPEIRILLRSLWPAQPQLQDRIWKNACLCMDAATWHRRVVTVCQAHGLPAPNGLDALPLGSGSNAVYMVGQHVVKLYLPMGSHDESAATFLAKELAFYRELHASQSPLLPCIPPLVASGLLFSSGVVDKSEEENGAKGREGKDGAGGKKDVQANGVGSNGRSAEGEGGEAGAEGAEGAEGEKQQEGYPFEVSIAPQEEQLVAAQWDGLTEHRPVNPFEEAQGAVARGRAGKKGKSGKGKEEGRDRRTPAYRRRAKKKAEERRRRRELAKGKKGKDGGVGVGVGEKGETEQGEGEEYDEEEEEEEEEEEGEEEGVWPYIITGRCPGWQLDAVPLPVNTDPYMHIAVPVTVPLFAHPIPPSPHPPLSLPSHPLIPPAIHPSADLATPADRQALADFFAACLSHLHSLPLPASPLSPPSRKAKSKSKEEKAGAQGAAGEAVQANGTAKEGVGNGAVESGGKEEEQEEEVVVSEEWRPFAEMMREHSKYIKERLEDMGSLPPHLVKQAVAYLPKDPALLFQGLERPSWLHTDIMSDNVLLAAASPAATPVIEEFVARGKDGVEKSNGEKPGAGEGGGEKEVAAEGERVLQPSSIIDFGTLILGDPLYDLVMLHVSAQRCNKADLARLFSTYKPPRPVQGAGANFTLSYRAMCYTLLNQNDALSRVFRYRKELSDVKTLEEIATAVWGQLDELV